MKKNERMNKKEPPEEPLHEKNRVNRERRSVIIKEEIINDLFMFF
jgi:hypothetical protein